MESTQQPLEAPPPGFALMSSKQHDEPKPNFLSALPAELICEIALRCPIRLFRQVARFDRWHVACTRIQRWYRSWNLNALLCLKVGDRVVVRETATEKMQYATAASMPLMTNQCDPALKVRLLDGRYVQKPLSRIRRLSDWADGPWADSVGRSSASASASEARIAADQAAHAAMAAMSSGITSTQTALALAAVTAASTAAAAAFAVATAAQVGTEDDLTSCQPAAALLSTAHQVQDVLHRIQDDVGAAREARARPAQRLSADSVTSLLAHAASEASRAAAEAQAAASAAAGVDAIGTLDGTNFTVATTALAAEHVVAAVDVLAEAPNGASTSSAAMIAAAESASDALAEVRVAGQALITAWAGSCGSSSSSSTAHALQTVHQAVQDTERALLEAGPTSLPPTKERSIVPNSLDLEPEPHLDRPKLSSSKPSDLVASLSTDHGLYGALSGGGELAATTPQPADFIPLPLDGKSLPCASPAFEAHTAHEFPLDAVAASLDGALPQHACTQSLVTVHQFQLRADVCEPLNKELMELAVQMRDGERTQSGLFDSTRENGVRQIGGRSSRGGFQSSGSLFDLDTKPCCTALHRIFSAAVHELGADSVLYADGEECLRPAEGESHHAHAWFNVNTGQDRNVLHTHDRSRWSAVYYVGIRGLLETGSGETDRRSDADVEQLGSDPYSGQMLFRANEKFLPVTPASGMLWLFPGSIPHLVMPMETPGLLRVSVGVNLYDAMPPPPREIRLISMTSPAATSAASPRTMCSATPACRAEGTTTPPKSLPSAFLPFQAGGQCLPDVASWLEHGCDALRARASGPPSKARGAQRQRGGVEEARSRSAALSVTADVHGVKVSAWPMSPMLIPSLLSAFCSRVSLFRFTCARCVHVQFSGREFQRLYYESKFVRRAMLVYNFLGAILNGDPSTEAHRILVKELTAHGSRKESMEVCSLGGGPGNDAAGWVAANAQWLGFVPSAATHTQREGFTSAARDELKLARQEAATAGAGLAKAEERSAQHERRAKSTAEKAERLRAAATAAAELVVAPSACSPSPSACDAKAKSKAFKASKDADAADAVAASALSVATSAKAHAVAAAARNEAAKAALVQALHKKPQTNAGDDPTADNEQSSARLRLHVSLLDREPQWKHYTSTLARYFEPMGASVDFSPCDVVVNLGGDCQTDVALKVSRAHAIIFSYVCHETSHAAAANGWAFYRGLAKLCKAGTLLLFFDIIGRSSQCFRDLTAAMCDEINLSGARGQGCQSPRLVRVPLPEGLDQSLHSEIMMLYVCDSEGVDTAEVTVGAVVPLQ